MTPQALALQEFELAREQSVLRPLELPLGLSVHQALDRVLRLPAVASKRYLTSKVHASMPMVTFLCPTGADLMLSLWL